MTTFKIDSLEFKIQQVLPTVYDDSLSFYELVNKVVEKLNEVIKTSNEYFAQDISITIRNKMVEWKDDGTLEQIINEAIFDDLNTQLTKVQDYLEGIGVNVKESGAKGDGVTDDTVAIQTAINSGKVVFFPEGTYKTTGSLQTAFEGQVLYGSGLKSVIVNDSLMSSDVSQKKNTINVLHKNVQIRNLTLEGNQQLDGALEKSSTGHNIYFSGAVDFNGLVENVLIKNGYVGVTVENGAYNVNFRNLEVWNCEHALQIFNATNVKVKGLKSYSVPYKTSQGWIQRNITLHSGAKNIVLEDLDLRGADTCGIFFRHEEGSTYPDNENIKISNVYIEGSGADPYSGLYFQEASSVATTKNVQFNNVHIKNCANGITYNGAIDSYGSMPLPVKDIHFVNLVIEGCVSSFQHTGSGFANTPPFSGLKLVNISATSNIRIKTTPNSIAENVSVTGGALTGIPYKNYFLDGVAQGDSELKLGGLPLKGIDQLSGTMPTASPLTVSYPTNYTSENTMILGFAVKKTNGVWEQILFIDRYNMTASNIQVLYNSTSYNSLPYKLIVGRF